MKKRMNGINRGRLQATDIYLTIKLSQDIRHVIHKWKTVARHKYFQKRFLSAIQSWNAIKETGISCSILSPDSLSRVV